jgi:hypothetical protein
VFAEVVGAVFVGVGEFEDDEELSLRDDVLAGDILQSNKSAVEISNV